jgi:hypothetical protein
VVIHHYRQVVALSFEFLYEYLQQRATVDWHQSLGHGVGDGFEACAQPCCKYECIHPYFVFMLVLSIKPADFINYSSSAIIGNEVSFGL